MNKQLNTGESYQVSRDYELLFELCRKGHRVVCFVDYDFRDGEKPCRDIARAEFNEDSENIIQVGARGTGYGRFTRTKEVFIEDCKRMNLEFIPPNVKPDITGNGINQNLFNKLFDLGFTALLSDMHEVKDAVFKDWEDNPVNISEEDYSRLRSILNIYEGEKQRLEFDRMYKENSINLSDILDFKLTRGSVILEFKVFLSDEDIEAINSDLRKPEHERRVIYMKSHGIIDMYINIISCKLNEERGFYNITGMEVKL